MGPPLFDDQGPEHGHTFHLVVATRLAYGMEGVPGKQDADWWSEPWTLEVRAWDLAAACRKAGEMPLTRWGMPVEAEDGIDQAEAGREQGPTAMRMLSEGRGAHPETTGRTFYEGAQQERVRGDGDDGEQLDEQLGHQAPDPRGRNRRQGLSCGRGRVRTCDRSLVRRELYR